MTGPAYFQRQNEFLPKTIHPMRNEKPGDFLVHYKESDLWAYYKDKDIASIQNDVQEYETGMKHARSGCIQEIYRMTRPSHNTGRPQFVCEI